MKAETVVGLRAVKAAVQENGSVKDTEVTKKMVEVVQQAAAKYREVLKQEKELKENKEKQKCEEEAKEKKIK